MKNIILTLVLLISGGPLAASTGKQNVCQVKGILSRPLNSKLHQWLQRPLEILKNASHPLGPMTYQSLCQGKAEVGTLADLLEQDYHHILNDFKIYKTKTWLRAKHFQTLGKRNSKALHELERHIDGYMWDNRLYISAKETPQLMAQTLVHEVNHVLNRSELHYYDSHASAFREEVRAFKAEEMFRLGRELTYEEMLKIKRRVLKDYGLTVVNQGREVKIDGLLLPNEKHWAEHWGPVVPNGNKKGVSKH